MRRLPRRQTILILLLVTELLGFNSLVHATLAVFAAGPTASASIDASSQSGSNSWYISAVTVNLSATPNGAAVKSITWSLDGGAQTTVNASSTTQTFTQNGTHVLTYFATDINDVQGTPGTLNFKIDTISPINWSNITQTRNGNAHTFEFGATITDATAGLDPTQVYMQYNVDDTGTTWGYYNNLLACNSTWNANQWYHLPTQSFSAGATSGTITTPAVDYCNSSGGGCDFMKVKIGDMAGNFAEKKICLGGAWLQGQDGNVYSNSSISMTSEGPQPNINNIIETSTGTVSSFTSSKNQIMTNYSTNESLTPLSYATLNAKYGSSAAALPSGKLPKTNGFFKVNGNLSVTSTVIPSGYTTTTNFANVILVNGTLTISTNITPDPSSVVVFVVNGDVNIHSSVTEIRGIYIASGTFDSTYNGNSSTQLVVKGSLLANGGFALDRNLGTTTNKTTPAEKIVFQPSYVLNKQLRSLIAGTVTYNWNETTP